MRELTKSFLSYWSSSSLFGLQQIANLFTPEGWQQTAQAAESFKRITKATTAELGRAAGNTFKVADDMQKRSMDLMFDTFTLGVFDRGKEGSASAGGPSGGPTANPISNLGTQAVSALTQGLQAAGQTAGVLMQSMTGFVSSPGCGEPRSQPTGWGPVPPPPKG